MKMCKTIQVEFSKKEFSFLDQKLPKTRVEAWERLMVELDDCGVFERA